MASSSLKAFAAECCCGLTKRRTTPAAAVSCASELPERASSWFLFDLKGRRLDLLKELRSLKGDYLDRQVRILHNRKVAVRLLAVRLPEEEETRPPPTRLETFKHKVRDFWGSLAGI